MTYDDASTADRRALATCDARGRDVGRTWRAADWVEDPLERVTIYAIAIYAIAVVTGFLVWTVLTAEDATGMTARDACVIAAVDDARAFADVMGDDRVVPVSFAARACDRQLG